MESEWWLFWQGLSWPTTSRRPQSTSVIKRKGKDVRRRKKKQAGPTWINGCFVGMQKKMTQHITSINQPHLAIICEEIKKEKKSPSSSSIVPDVFSFIISFFNYMQMNQSRNRFFDQWRRTRALAPRTLATEKCSSEFQTFISFLVV